MACLPTVSPLNSHRGSAFESAVSKKTVRLSMGLQETQASMLLERASPTGFVQHSPSPHHDARNYIISRSPKGAENFSHSTPERL